MTEQKHTPGPWEQGDPSRGESDLMVYCDDALGTRIADCTNEMTVHSLDEKRANARLIAAAPALLATAVALVAAMRRYEVEVEGDAPFQHVEMMRHADAAISRATGESSNE